MNPKSDRESNLLDNLLDSGHIREIAFSPPIASTRTRTFWSALREVFATTREQRCWVHKTMNVLNAMPKSMQAKAKGHLLDIWQAETPTFAHISLDIP